MKLIISIFIISFHLIFFLIKITFNVSNTLFIVEIWEYLFVSLLLIWISIYDLYYLKIAKYIVEIGFALVAFFILSKESITLNDLLNIQIIGSLVIFFTMKFSSLLLYKLTKKSMLGLGDAKIASFGGFLLGLEEGFKAMAISFITAGLFTIFGRISGKLKPWQAFPFAPFIGFGIQIIWNFGKYF